MNNSGSCLEKHSRLWAQPTLSPLILSSQVQTFFTACSCECMTLFSPDFSALLNWWIPNKGSDFRTARSLVILQWERGENSQIFCPVLASSFRGIWFNSCWRYRYCCISWCLLSSMLCNSHNMRWNPSQRPRWSKATSFLPVDGDLLEWSILCFSHHSCTVIFPYCHYSKGIIPG